MSSDFEAYEQDFGTITAEVTNKIGRIPKLSGGKTDTFISWSCAQLELVPIQLVFLSRWGRLTVVSVLCVKITIWCTCNVSNKITNSRLLLISLINYGSSLLRNSFLFGSSECSSLAHRLLSVADLYWPHIPLIKLKSDINIQEHWNWK